MSVFKSTLDWLGITSPKWLHEAVARRNMPILVVGSVVVALFAGMLAFCLITNTPCLVDGFDEAARETPAITFRYTATSVVVAVAMVLIFFFSLFYLRKKWVRPGIATFVTIAFVFLVAVLWGIAVSGYSADRQLLIFASIQFLVAGLIIFDPIVSLVYFPAVYFVFGVALDLSGMLSYPIMKDLVYLALLDIIVCWVVYGLFMRASERERAVVDLSQRDELTGARNRHSLREAFPTYIGVNLSIMICDIDDFKHYNDDYDHTTGDTMLKEFSYALCEAFGEERVYRFGGDEFLVVAANMEPAEFAAKAAKTTELLSRVKIDGVNAGLKYSGGYVRGLADDATAFRDMLHAADENLLEAKRAGKNQIVGL